MSAQGEAVQCTLQYGDERLRYEVVTQARPRQRILIKVHPDCRIEVVAPVGASPEEVHEAVGQRARWIYQQVVQFREAVLHLAPRQYVSGETHYYLGKRYVLKVITSPHEVQQVKLLAGRIEVRVRQEAVPAAVSRLLEEWYRVRSKDVFGRRLEALLPQALWVTQKPEFQVRTMERQWGSCSPGGRILLNPNLVKARRECIDYVILHELCHVAEHNHGERFYRLLNQVMPGWENVKKELDARAAEYLNL